MDLTNCDLAIKVCDEMEFSDLEATNAEEIELSALKATDGEEMKFSALKAMDGEEMKFSALKDIYKLVEAGIVKSIMAIELIQSQSGPMTEQWREHEFQLLITSAFEYIQTASLYTESFRDELEKQIVAAYSEQDRIQSDLHKKDDKIQEIRSEIDKMTTEKHKLTAVLDENEDSYKMQQGDRQLHAAKTNMTPALAVSIGIGFVCGLVGGLMGAVVGAAVGGIAAVSSAGITMPRAGKDKMRLDKIRKLMMGIYEKKNHLKHLEKEKKIIIFEFSNLSKRECFLRGLLNGTQEMYLDIQGCCTILNDLSTTPWSHILESFPTLCSRLYDLPNCLTLPNVDWHGDLIIGYKNETVTKTMHYKLLLSVGLGHEENVYYILNCMSERGLVSEKSLKEAINISIGLRSRNITNMLLKFASKLLKEKGWSGQIQDVWPAYKEKFEWVPMFVVMYRQMYSHEKQHEYLGYEIAWRQYDFVSQEASIVATSNIVKDNPLSYDEMKSMKELIRKANLFRHHRNISVVSACPCKSKKGGHDIVLKKCIVIYTSVKGLIPFDEQPFPKSISGVPVDVREAYMRLGMFRKGRYQTSTQALYQSQYFSPRVSLSTSTPMETSPPHTCVDEITTNCMNTNLNSPIK